MKAPGALKRVGRSIGVMRAKARNTVKRSNPGQELVEKEKSPVVDVRDDGDAQNVPDPYPVDENEPRDFLTMMRSGSLEDDGMAQSAHLDKALMAIENEQPEQISLPPGIYRKERESSIYSPPNVQSNPMTFANDDADTIFMAASMARSMSKLLSTAYNKIVEEGNSVIQDAVSFTDSKTDENAARQGPPIDEQSPKDDSPEEEQGREEQADLPVTVRVDASSTGMPIQTPLPIMPNEDDEDVTVTTEGPDVVLPPTVQNRSGSISDRAPIKRESAVSAMKSAFSGFGGKLSGRKGNDPTLMRVIDAFRDIFCCPEMEDDTVPMATKDLRNKRNSRAVKDDDDENETAKVSQTSDLLSGGKDADSFEEIAEATLLVSDMIKLKGSFTSEQCNQVEKALKVLEEKAKKIGVNESDLLAAMASSEDASADSQVKKIPSTIGVSG